MRSILRRFNAIVLTNVLLFVSISMFAQGVGMDTILIKDTYYKYQEAKCLERKKIMQFVIDDDTASLNKALRTVTANFNFDQLTNVNTLLTTGEAHLTYFITNRFELILKDIRKNKDFFNVSWFEGVIQAPMFSCGVIGQDLLSKWQNASEQVFINIQNSDLTSHEKELLTFYWKAIILAIEEKPSDLNKLIREAEGILNSESNSSYNLFFSRMSRINATYHPNLHHFMGPSIGPMVLGGPIIEYLEPDGLGLSGEYGLRSNRWSFSFKTYIAPFRYGENKLQFIGGDSLTNSEGVGIRFLSLRSSFIMFPKRRFQIHPYLGIAFIGLTNIKPESDTTDYPKEFIDWKVDAGFSLNYLLFQGKGITYIDLPSTAYGNRAFMNLYLQLNAGVIPNLFNRLTNVSGNLFYFTIGASVEFGKSGLKYRFRKKTPRNR